MWQAAISKSVYVHPRLLTSLKCHFHYTNSCFSFTLVFILTPGVFIQSFWPSLGHGSRVRNSGIDIIHLRANGVMEFIVLK